MNIVNEQALIAENNLNFNLFFTEILNKKDSSFLYVDDNINQLKQLILLNLEKQYYNTTIFRKTFGDLFSIFPREYIKSKDKVFLAEKFKNFFITENNYLNLPCCLFENNDINFSNNLFTMYFTLYFNYFIKNYTDEELVEEMKNIFNYLITNNLNKEKAELIIVNALLSTLNNFSLILIDPSFSQELINRSKNNPNILENYFLPTLTPTAK